MVLLLRLLRIRLVLCPGLLVLRWRNRLPLLSGRQNNRLSLLVRWYPICRSNRQNGCGCLGGLRARQIGNTRANTVSSTGVAG